jgi:hypothetical protein
MKRVLASAVAVFVALLAFSTSAMAISVTATNNGNTLVSNILGSGITVVGGSISYTGATTQAGTYTGGVASGLLGLDEGIIMTSGNANLAPGPNNQDAAGLDLGTAGDADLNGLIPGFTTYDANVLEFDFTTAGGDLFFDFAFASEEYNEWTNSSFNDVFGFFLDGTNIALITGTSTPVSINNVNGGNPLGVGASNPGFYNNNDPSDTGIPTPFDIQYDGFTDTFTASALGLGAGTHHIKLAIADAGDGVLDSAVFIKKGSFSDTSSVPEPATILLLGSGLFGLGLFGRKRINS